MSTKYLIESVPANVDRRVEVKCRGDGFRRKLYKWLAGADEAFTDRGRKDLARSTDCMPETMIGWLNQLQHAPRDPRDRAEPLPLTTRAPTAAKRGPSNRNRNRRLDMNSNVPVPPSNGGGLSGDRVTRGTVARWSATTGWTDRDGLPLPDTMLVVGYTTVLRRWKDHKPEYITEQPLPDPNVLNDAIPVGMGDRHQRPSNAAVEAHLRGLLGRS